MWLVHHVVLPWICAKSLYLAHARQFIPVGNTLEWTQHSSVWGSPYLMVLWCMRGETRCRYWKPRTMFNFIRITCKEAVYEVGGLVVRIRQWRLLPCVHHCKVRFRFTLASASPAVTTKYLPGFFRHVMFLTHRSAGQSKAQWVAWCEHWWTLPMPTYRWQYETCQRISSFVSEGLLLH